MAEIKPFKGILYNTTKIEDYSTVVAPPYDVISESMREQLYNKNTHNIIRLILGKSLETDDEHSNKYVRAKNFIDEWQQEGILTREASDSFYVYLQEYNIEDKKCKRVGFIGLMKIGDSDNDVGLPHEYTHSKPIEDRLNLMKQVESNLSPIFTLYLDGDGEIK